MQAQGRQRSITGKSYRLADSFRVRTGKGQNQEGEKKRDWKKQELRNKNNG
jgi:hypothetical protein